VLLLQVPSLRWPSHVTGTLVSRPLRITTDCRGIAVGQSCVDQTRSGPDVTLSTSDRGETRKVHAGVVRVVSSRSTTVLRPAYARPGRCAVTSMSPSEHGPDGTASGDLVRCGFVVGEADACCWSARAVGVGVRSADALGVGPNVGRCDETAPTGRAAGPVPPPPPRR
jgi:hypothetical protein